MAYRSSWSIKSRWSVLRVSPGTRLSLKCRCCCYVCMYSSCIHAYTHMCTHTHTHTHTYTHTHTHAGGDPTIERRATLQRPNRSAREHQTPARCRVCRALRALPYAGMAAVQGIGKFNLTLQILNSRLSTQNAIPYTLYPIPYTLNPKPYTLYPIPYTLYPNRGTLNPKPYTPNHMQAWQESGIPAKPLYSIGPPPPTSSSTAKQIPPPHPWSPRFATSQTSKTSPGTCTCVCP